MQHLLQQFYSSADPNSVPALNWELQPLYTSSAGLSEQYYSDILPNAIQPRPLQTTFYPEINSNATQTETLHTQDTDISNTVPTATRISLYPETNPDIIQRTLHTQDSDIIPNNVPAASQPSFDTEINPNITLTETLHTQVSDITPSLQTYSLQTVEVSLK
ncbi:unnamed protein product [Cylicocyclus nassatus]|uniref:Uncharacterized protein n=1 Tax=Cylicocyclus nassatus TaxID=53992 RepID=A0AA36GGM9_CYLNA|nr:unnamed protein product [Cylicocyclus nassatus]